MPDPDPLETRRRSLQAAIDGGRSRTERNRLGQFATPPGLALEILQAAAALLPAHQAIRFLDPAFGTGAFFGALRAVFPCSSARITEAAGYEIDPAYGGPAAALWADAGLALSVSDFTRARPDARFTLVICNPPYVRHHHLSAADKARLQAGTLAASGARIGGLAGLYCHFLAQAHGWMAPGAVAGWLIPSEFMDVNYGVAVKRYLLEQVTLVRIHRFDPTRVQFPDALVSSAVVFLRAAPPPPAHAVDFTFGGSVVAPAVTRSVPAAVLAAEPKWTRFPLAGTGDPGGADTVALSQFFRIKRGLATGDNAFFILNEAEIARRRLPIHLFRPILPGPRHVPDDVIDADADGLPRLARRGFLLDPRLDEATIAAEYPTLAAYLAEGRAKGLPERYLCRHRTLWYAQEVRPPPPLLCTYLGRAGAGGRAFRFILNRSQATVANVWLALYPNTAVARAFAGDSGLAHRVWQALNRVVPAQLADAGRVYGGGLRKLEPGELARLPVPALADLLPVQPP